MSTVAQKSGRVSQSDSLYHAFCLCLQHSTILEFLPASDRKALRLACHEVRDIVNEHVADALVTGRDAMLQTQLAKAFPRAIELKVNLSECTQELALEIVEHFRQSCGKLLLEQLEDIVVEFINDESILSTGFVVEMLRRY
jgi:hypothetical protein